MRLLSIGLSVEEVNQQNENYKFNWFGRDKTWRARIKIHGKEIHLGYFVSEDEAAKAYDKKAKELFSEFAHTNF